MHSDNTPLIHARGSIGIGLGSMVPPIDGMSIMAHVAYLVVAGIAAFCVAMYRLERTLIK
jgi:hypothetical protein